MEEQEDFAAQQAALGKVIGSSFELEHTEEYISRARLAAALADKVRYMMQYQLEELFSRLYRLDIFERKIKEVMAAGGDIAQKIADLIIDRQLEKNISKQENPPSTPEDEDLAW
ncbi:MAG: hypothetical protein JNM21_04655 [Taibaiella sp.]|nr:hypothetical protein [Taibaiella sp.]